ncbi:two component transcriptional regulator, LuxR family, partial [Aduncisulcus paluster]
SEKEEKLEESLSDRERQIFTLMGQGFGNTEIADELGLSRRTVETYCNRMARKFDLNGRKELRKYAISAS